MKGKGIRRREFLKGALAGGAVAAGCAPTTAVTPDKSVEPAGPRTAAEQGSEPRFPFFTTAEAAFVAAMVDHMVPADELSPKGTDLGVHVYIDRALAGPWGKGESLYLKGPFKRGTPNQGYQLPYSPAQIFRAGIEATDRHCVASYGKQFAALHEPEREAVLKGLDSASIRFEDGPPAKLFFELAYRTVMEGLFADPIHGGNRGKAGWKMVGFPGVPAAYRKHIGKFRDRPYPSEPSGIGDRT